MNLLDNNIQVFLELVRAGLWEKEARLTQFGKMDYDEVMRLAEEQSVVGLVTAGLEQIDVSGQEEDGRGIPSQEDLLQFVGQSLQIEQVNKDMNAFVAELIEKLRSANVNGLLVKGQGVAQCYERPLWRASGDVDLLLSQENYEKAKDFLLSMASDHKPDERYSKHLGMSIDQWYVEIHGTLRTGLSGRVDREVDEVQRDVFYNGNVRSWMNGNTTVFLPSSDNDVFFVFTHFIKHFYKEGMNLRQVCDWCRLLWTYRDKVDVKLLEKRLRRAELMSEWRGFAALAVDWLGMPKEAMPFYNENDNYNNKKAEKIVRLILSGYTGNKYKDTLRIARIYPWNTLKFLPGILFHLNWMKVKERLYMK